ncbi:MAG: phosphopantothenoylcysteine decarboxylase, partial [Verrucomicrobiota bacterium]|nr:phosphopantothenoylcysteine decarboxylase [Verrucomicrobiota bacterium]
PSARFDAVLLLTNHPPGRGGTGLPTRWPNEGHGVILLRGALATHTEQLEGVATETFTTTDDLAEKLERLAKQQPEVGAVFHTAAVSDFEAGAVLQKSDDGKLTPLRQGKVSTREGSLLLELLPTQKIISDLRGWFLGAQLVGWKYEVDGDRASALGQAQQQLADNTTDACVINGPAYGEGFGLLKTGDEAAGHLANGGALFDALARLAKRD